MKIKDINRKEEDQLKDWEIINFDNKEFRIYEWENKEIGDFEIPNGFRLCKHSEFIELFDNKLIDYPKGKWVYYFVEHYSKRKTKKGLLSRCYLDYDSDLFSYNSFLSDSNDNGRVVVVKISESNENTKGDNNGR